MPSAASRVVRILIVVGVSLAGSILSAAAQTAEPRPAVRHTYHFGVSSAPMIRNADLFSLGGELADRGADTALDRLFGTLDEKSGRKPALGRIARLWFVDLPIAMLVEGGNHEYGHVLRAWPGEYHLQVTHWPWPIPLSGLEVWMMTPPPAQLSNLSAIAGGAEADFVNSELLLDRIYGDDRASHFDLVLYAVAKAHRSFYIFLGAEGDPSSYAEELAAARARPFGPRDGEDQAMMGSIRKGAWLNFLDYAFVTTTEQALVDYIGRGRSVVRPRWLKLGRLRLVPSVNYTFTPRGQQYRVSSRIRLERGVGNVYVRWTQPLQAGWVQDAVQRWNTRPVVPSPFVQRRMLQAPYVVKLLGAGAEFHSTSTGAIGPTASVDAWRDIDGRGGGRLEGGVFLRFAALGPDRALRLALGGKTSGYLSGFPDGRGIYVTGALLADF